MRRVRVGLPPAPVSGLSEISELWYDEYGGVCLPDSDERDSDMEDEDRTLDGNEPLRPLPDGTHLRPSQVQIPDEVQGRIESLQRAMQRREDALADGGGAPGERGQALAGTGAILREIWEDFRQELREELSRKWTPRRKLVIERRKAEVKRRLAGPPELPDWLRLLPDGVLTAKQQEAMVLCHGYGLSLAEAAEVAGIGKSTMRNRAQAAKGKVESYWHAGGGRDILMGAALRMAYKIRAVDELWEYLRGRGHDMGARHK